MEQRIQPTEQKYHLKCSIVKKKISYIDTQSDGVGKLMEADFIYLVPQESSQRDLFLDAWLPDTRGEVVEVGCRAGNPICGYFRGYIRRANNIINKPHIGIMSLGAEQDLIDFHNRKSFWQRERTIEIEILGEQDEHLLDQARNAELPFEKKKYIEDTSVKVE